MKYSATNKPLQCMMTQSTCYKGTRTMNVVGVLWHSTGANNPWLKRYVQPDDNAANRAALIAKIGKNSYNNDWNHIDIEAGLNCWIGKLADGTVTTVQTMPWNYRPWGCGSGNKGSCNSGWIQFEICEDGLTDAMYFNQVYKEACEITAYLCQMYGIDPHGSVNGVPTILCHHDSYKLGMGSNHGDIDHWFPKHGKSMATARNDVAALLKGAGVTPSTPAKPSTPTTTSAFKAGDLVKITGTKYYSGADIPAWVKAKNWYVKEASGSRVVIDKSEDGKNAICSPVNAADLALAKTTTPAAPATPAPATIKVGDIVKITGTKYYSGAKIPDWVRAKNWIVKEVSGARVVIDKSQDGKNAICSPVNAADLAVVTASAAKPATPVVNTTIEAGDTVKIVGTKYYSGAKIPDWVKAKNWIVLDAKGDRVVVDKSADGKNAICSPIKRSDLQLVKKK